MVINDLKESCPRCGGSGRMAGITSMGIPQINIGGLCGQCGGRGFTLTELGRDVVELLKPFIEEMIAEAVPPLQATAPPEANEDEEQ